MAYFKKIMGEKVYLSPISAKAYDEDVLQYTKWVNDINVSDNLGITWQNIGVDAEIEYLEGLAKKGYNFAIVKKEGDNLIGGCSIFNINQISRNAECGIFIGDEENRNKGYGTDAIILLLKYAFKILNLNNMMLKVYSFNEQAVKCYKNIGFNIIGLRRNSYFINSRYYDEIFMDILACEFVAT